MLVLLLMDSPLMIIMTILFEIYPCMVLCIDIQPAFRGFRFYIYETLDISNVRDV